MSRLWGPIFSREDLIDSKLERLPYRSLQAIALAMDIPGNIRRIDMIYFIRAVRDGHYNVVQDYKRLLSEYPHIPCKVSYLSQPIHHHQQQYIKEVKPPGSSFTEDDRLNFATQEIDDGQGVLLIDNLLVLDLERIWNSCNSRHSLKEAGENGENHSQYFKDALTRSKVNSYTGHFSSDQVLQTEEGSLTASTNNAFRPVGSKRQHESHQNLCKNAQTIYKSQPTKKFLLSQHYEKNENDSKRPPEFICKSQILFNNDGSKYIKYSTPSQGGMSYNLWNSIGQNEINRNYGVNVSRQQELTCCPCIGCKVTLPSYNLAQHVLQAHETEVHHTFDEEIRFKLLDLQKRKKILNIQSVSNRIFVTTMDYRDGFIYVTVQHLPDSSDKKSTAVILIKKRNGNVNKWEGYVQSYDNFTCESHFCLKLNLNNCSESEQLGIQTMIFYEQQKFENIV